MAAEPRLRAGRSGGLTAPGEAWGPAFGDRHPRERGLVFPGLRAPWGG